MSFPTFNGATGEDAQEFLDNLEIACLVIGRDDDATRLRVFPLLMKAEAKVWFNTLLPTNRGDWARLRVLFLAKFGGGGETSESLWGKVCELRQGSLFEYNVYEVQFVELWERWVASLRLGEAAPDFLKKDCFVASLCPPLIEKVKGRFLVTWMDARDIARLKERKISTATNAPMAHRGQGNQDQQELLSRITHQLEDLSVHLVRGGRGPPPNQEQARGPRRQAQEYHCYNCRENVHGMYYCPHPRRIGNFRGPRNQVSPPRERQQQQPPFPIQQAPPVQILRPPVQPQQQQPPPPPPPIAPIPPLPIPENRAVNVINLDAKVKAEEEERGKSLPKDKGKAKVEDVDAMPIKRPRQEEAAMSETGERRKSKENGESSSKKKSKPRRKLTIKDFALGESSQPYNLVDDVSVQGPKITWPQLLHMAPKVCRQWTKMVSTRRVKTKAMGLVFGRNLQDITPVLNAYVKGQRVSNVYVDGGAQICVITEQTMHRLGLKGKRLAPSNIPSITFSDVYKQLHLDSSSKGSSSRFPQMFSAMQSFPSDYSTITAMSPLSPFLNEDIVDGFDPFLRWWSQVEIASYAKRRVLPKLPNPVKESNYLQWFEKEKAQWTQELKACKEVLTKQTSENPLAFWGREENWVSLPGDPEPKGLKATHPGMSLEDVKLCKDENYQILADDLISPSNNQYACQAFYVNNHSEQKRGKK
ncbi:hypothetical protein L7F22_052361 [Adiantum nelumboides]|nr:hypothetical protein [Adiantum nelumboides]